MSILRLTGSRESVYFAVGSTDITTNWSAALLIRPSLIDYRVALAGHDSGGIQRGYAFEMGASGEIGIYTWGGGELFSPSVAFATGVWTLAIITKATGTVRPRFHFYRFDTRRWTHEDASSTITNASTIAGGSMRLGEWATDYWFPGDYAAAAMWSRVLSDSECERLLTLGNLTAWSTLSPAALWLFNQPDVATRIQDIIGAADETRRVGTTAVIAEDPPIPYTPVLSVTVNVEGVETSCPAYYNDGSRAVRFSSIAFGS